MLFLMLFNSEEHDKFTRLYINFHGALLNYAYSILRDKRLSEEAVQDAFVRILKNLDKLSENTPGKTWYYMMVVVKNVSLSILKKEKASLYLDLGETGLERIKDSGEPIWSEYQAKELYQKIKDYIIENLNETDRNIMILRSVHKMSYKDIAEIVGITESNVSARLSRMRRKMKADLSLGEASYEQFI